LKVPVEWEQYNVSGETAAGEGLFQEAMESLRRNKVGLKGESLPLVRSLPGLLAISAVML